MSSGDEKITKLWKNTNIGTDIQYDFYRNTKQTSKSILNKHHRVHHICPPWAFPKTAQFTVVKSSKQTICKYLQLQHQIPKQYVCNYTKSPFIESFSNFCLFLLSSAWIFHIAAGCKTYLDQGCYTWWHNLALGFVTQAEQSRKSAELYADFLAISLLAPLLVTVFFRTSFLLQLTMPCTLLYEL